MIQVHSQNIQFQGSGSIDSQLLLERLRSINSGFVINSYKTCVISHCQFSKQQTAQGVVQLNRNIGSTTGTSQNNRSVPVVGDTQAVRYIHNFNTELTIISSKFYGATNTALYSLFSYVYIQGMVVFDGNSGNQGGAIALYGSGIAMTSGANILFCNNHANSLGGAIFASNEILDSYLFSVHQYMLTTSYTVSMSCSIFCFSTNISVNFVNNTAINGGSATYGISLNSKVCDSGLCTQHTNLSKIFKFEPEEPAAVSSDPLRVCICQEDRLPNCSIQDPHYGTTVLPGQNINLSLAVVGLVYGTVRSTVTAQLLHPAPESVLGSDYEDSQTIFGCTDIQYKVHSARKNETLVFTVLNDPHEISDRPLQGRADYKSAIQSLKYPLPQTIINSALYVAVNVRECPVGFNLSTISPVQCECASTLKQNGFTQQDCNAESQTIKRSGTVWLGYTERNSTSPGVLLHNHCPFGYCKSEVSFVDLRNPDSQCSQQRSGILCGACKVGLSLSLGSSNCMECTNTYLTLLVPFIAAGAVLVFVIKVLNLTVSVGTINGLIIFVNVVGANQAIFFPDGHTVTKILTVFISWLNLDLGIETCFFNGLDSYWKTWLQFVFPLYIWSIAIIIIVASHISTTVTKVIGNNSVPVLATLLLLSFGKLLHTIIAIFSVAMIDYPDGSRHLVWAFDGNVPYLGIKHIPLFVVAFVVIILWVPYTFILLSGHTIRRCTSHKRLRWMLKLQFFFDAYHGPFNDKHVHWVGTLLVVRIILFNIFAAFFATETSVNLLSISITCVVLLMYTPTFGFAYKKRWVSLLESSFLLNLSILSSGTFYIEMTRGNGRDWLVGVSVGVAFVQFLGIVIYHSCTFTFKRLISKVKIQVETRRNTNPHFFRLRAMERDTPDHSDNEERAVTSSPQTETGIEMVTSSSPRAGRVTETIIENPRLLEPMTKLLGHYEDRHITGTTYCSQ